MSWLCDKPCNNKTPFGYCKTTYCIYGTTNQFGATGYAPPLKNTNADRITSSVEALAKFIVEIADCSECEEMHGFRMCDAAPEKTCDDCWAGWLRQEAT